VTRRLREPAVSRVIADAAGLERYARGPGNGGCTLQLPGLAAEDARYWEGRFSRLQAICGCTAGLLAGLSGLALWIALGQGSGWSSMGSALLGGFGSAVLPAVAAKVASLAVARMRLRHACRQLLAGLECAPDPCSGT
jgi:hypothetical protein